METVIETVQQIWVGFQHGQFPDFGGWNYMIMALFVIVQGRVSALLGGIAAAAGSLNLGLIVVVALAARVLVDLVWYAVGASGVMMRLSRRLGPVERLVAQVQGGMSQHPQRMMLLAKLSNGLATPALLGVGGARLPIRRWLPGSLAGELIWFLPLVFVGFFAADAVASVEGGLVYLTAGLTVASLLLLLLKPALGKWRAWRQPL